MRPSHREIDAQNELKARLLARRLRWNGRLLRLAQSNLRRWKARDGKRSRPAFVEWQRILEHLSAKEVADFPVSDTPMARRLRQSSPFLGRSSPRPAGPRGAGEKARTENRPQGGGRVAREREFFVIGSQAFHAHCNRLPAFPDRRSKRSEERSEIHGAAVNLQLKLRQARNDTLSAAGLCSPWKEPIILFHSPQSGDRRDFLSRISQLGPVRQFKIKKTAFCTLFAAFHTIQVART
jgi:hypothetical protein